MLRVNEVLEDEAAARKEKVKKTWREIIMKGIETYEIEQQVINKKEAASD